LDPLGGSFGPAETGSAIHAALARFVGDYPAGILPDDARGKLTALLHEAFAAQLLDPVFVAFNWPRLQKMIGFYLDFEARRRIKSRELKRSARANSIYVFLMTLYFA